MDSGLSRDNTVAQLFALSGHRKKASWLECLFFSCSTGCSYSQKSHWKWMCNKIIQAHRSYQLHFVICRSPYSTVEAYRILTEFTRKTNSLGWKYQVFFYDDTNVHIQQGIGLCGTGLKRLGLEWCACRWQKILTNTTKLPSSLNLCRRKLIYSRLHELLHFKAQFSLIFQALGKG